MGGFGFQTLPGEMMAAPAAPPAAPPPAPQAPPQAAPQAYQPSKFDIFMDMLANGHAPADAAAHVRSLDYQKAQQGMMMDALQKMDPQMRQAILFGGAEAAKNFGPQIGKPGDRIQYFGPGGPGSDVPTTGIGPQGAYAMSPQGYRPLTGTLPGKKTMASNGSIIDENLGPTGENLQVPQIVPPGNTPGTFTAGVAGPGSAPPSPQAAPADRSLPRGIRNNNFGNVKTPPQGAWQGQVGVDPEGHAIFATPEDGARAAAMNLQSYGKQGINTVAGVVDRWANTGTVAQKSHYAAYVAGALGVDPRAQIDVTDPKIAQPMLRAMFQFENGPKAMNAWRGPVRGQGAPQGGQAGAGWTMGQRQGVPSIVDPKTAAAKGFAPGAVVEQDAAGGMSVKQPPEYGPEAKSKLRSDVLGSDEYKQAKSALSAYQSMIANAGKMNGPSGYAILDTFARAINPGAVARPQVIETISHSLGVPNTVVGNWYNMMGAGKLTPQAQQQILDAVQPFVASHWEQANRLNESNRQLAKAHGFNEADVTAPLEGRPLGVALTPQGPAFKVTSPEDVKALPKGAMFRTPDGRFKRVP